MEWTKVDEMVGQTFTKVWSDDDTVTFENDQVRYTLYHEPDCCEHVYVEDVCGDLEDLMGSPMLVSREDTNIDEGAKNSYDESYTWTFYNFATLKGSVSVRFYGTSNGYYSEGVSFKKEFLNN